MRAQSFIRRDDEDNGRARSEIVADTNAITGANELIITLLKDCNDFQSILNRDYYIPSAILTLGSIDGSTRFAGWLLRNAVLIIAVPFVINLIIALALLIWEFG